MKIPPDALDLRGDRTIRVFLRTDIKEPSYYVQILVPMEARDNPRNPYAFRSLDTTDERTAIQRAWEKWSEISRRISSGQSVNSRPFRTVAEGFIEKMEREMKVMQSDGFTPVCSPDRYRRYKGILERFYIPYFGDKMVDAITKTDVERYLIWRKDYYITGPGAEENKVKYSRKGKAIERPFGPKKRPSGSTLRQEITVYSQVMQYASAQGWVNLPLVPKPQLDRKEKRSINRRLAFTRSEWRLLERTMRHREQEYENHPDQGTYWERKQLHLWVKFLYYTGIRVSEAKHLKWKHILRQGPQHLRIEIAPDNPGLKDITHVRKVIPIPAVKGVLAQLKQMYMGKAFDELVSDEDYLWQSLRHYKPGKLHTGHPNVEEYNRSFDALLKAAGLLKKHGIKMAPTSLRHTYATERLYTEVSTNFLADNMGTTEEMIRRHYRHVLLELRAQRLEAVADLDVPETDMA